jgi:N-acyl-L-homoserine lactone synthetase
MGMGAGMGEAAGSRGAKTLVGVTDVASTRRANVNHWNGEEK